MCCVDVFGCSCLCGLLWLVYNVEPFAAAALETTLLMNAINGSLVFFTSMMVGRVV